MNMVALYFKALILSLLFSCAAVSSQKDTPPLTPISHNNPLSDLCGNLEQSLAPIGDEKIKGIITALCTLSRHGKVAYIDKMQLTINIQGDDVTYTENYKHKDNYGLKNKPSSSNHKDSVTQEAQLMKKAKWKKAEEIQDSINNLMEEISELSHQYDHMVKSDDLDEEKFNTLNALTNEKADKLDVLMKALEEEIKKIS